MSVDPRIRPQSRWKRREPDHSMQEETVNCDLPTEVSSVYDLDETLPATPIFIDDDTTTCAPCEARFTLASGRRYEVRVAEDGADHVLVTTKGGTVALSLLVTDDGPVLTFASGDAYCPPCAWGAAANDTVTLPVYRPTLPDPRQVVSAPALPLEQFVALSAELTAFPERARDTMTRYGIRSEAEFRRLERAWYARIADDPALERRSQGLYDACARWLATVSK